MVVNSLLIGRQYQPSEITKFARKIEPIEPPPGYRLIDPKVDTWQRGDKWFSPSGNEWVCANNGGQFFGTAFTYARKLEPKYRPFKDADEFEPHRERWLRPRGGTRSDMAARYCVCEYDNTRIWIIGQLGLSYAEAFELREFEDGEPFGVEIK